MTIHTKDAGIWKPVETPWVKDAGVWKSPSQVYVKDAGVWKPAALVMIGSQYLTLGTSFGDNHADDQARTSIPLSTTSTGKRIRIRIRAHTGGNTFILAYCGVAAGADYFDMEPSSITQLFFGGSAGVTLAGLAETWSDWANISFPAGARLIASFGYSSASQGIQYTTGLGSSYRAGRDANTAASAGNATFAEDTSFSGQQAICSGYEIMG